MPTIVMSIQQNKVSTAFDDIFLLILLPTNPPTTPEKIMVASMKISISGMEEVAKENIKLAVWAKKIIYNEFKAAVLVFIEKKK